MIQANKAASCEPTINSESAQLYIKIGPKMQYEPFLTIFVQCGLDAFILPRLSLIYNC
jgi:hypothetical protein